MGEETEDWKLNNLPKIMLLDKGWDQPPGMDSLSEFTMCKSQGILGGVCHAGKGLATGLCRGTRVGSRLYSSFGEAPKLKKSQSQEINASSLVTPRVLALQLLAIIQEIQEVKEGGQRKSPRTSRRARCSLCHSCCYESCFNPHPQPSPIPSNPHTDQLLRASVGEAWGGVGGRCQASPRLLASPCCSSWWSVAHHPCTLSESPRSDTLAGQRQVQGQVPGESRPRERLMQKLKLWALHSHPPSRGGNVNEGWTYPGSQSPYSLDSRVLRFMETFSGLDTGGGKDHWLKSQVIQVIQREQHGKVQKLERTENTVCRRSCKKFNMAGAGEGPQRPCKLR